MKEPKQVIYHSLNFSDFGVVKLKRFQRQNGTGYWQLENKEKISEIKITGKSNYFSKCFEKYQGSQAIPTVIFWDRNFGQNYVVISNLYINRRVCFARPN